MKKVLHVTFDMRIGGTEQVIKNLIEGTDKDQYEPSILCLEEPIGPFGEALIKKGVKIHTIPRQDGFDPGLILKIRQYIKKNNINILHCHQYTPWVYGVLAAFMTRTRVIFTEHGRFYPDSTSWKRALINPLLVMMTDKITTISKATKKALVEYEYIPLKKIEVIYNGIFALQKDKTKADKIRLEWKISPTTNILGTIARLDSIKNQKMMLEAFKITLNKHPNTVLFIVGDGEERESLEILADKLEVSDKVLFTGYITEPIDYLSLMDIFLLSSLSEGTSMTLLEAMSLGKPCVVTDAGGNSEIIEHAMNGIVTENANAIAFADGINKLLDNSSKRYSMAKASFQRYQQCFSVSQMVDKYQTIYQTIVK